MFIVALYLVIKEHKICLWFFYVNTPWRYFFLFHFFLLWVRGVHATVSTCIPFIISPFTLLFSFLPFTLIPTSVFAPPSCFLSHTLPLSVCPSLSLSLWLLYRSNMDTNLGEDFWFPQMWTNPRRSLTAKRCCSWANKHFTVFVTIL